MSAMRFFFLVPVMLDAVVLQAAMFCSEPSPPSCVTMNIGGFSNKFDFDMCKLAMERYASEVKEYSDCLERGKAEAVENFNKAVKKFNCYARGETLCI